MVEKTGRLQNTLSLFDDIVKKNISLPPKLIKLLDESVCKSRSFSHLEHEYIFVY